MSKLAYNTFFFFFKKFCSARNAFQSLTKEYVNCTYNPTTEPKFKKKIIYIHKKVTNNLKIHK